MFRTSLTCAFKLKFLLQRGDRFFVRILILLHDVHYAQMQKNATVHLETHSLVYIEASFGAEHGERIPREGNVSVLSEIFDNFSEP